MGPKFSAKRRNLFEGCKYIYGCDKGINSKGIESMSRTVASQLIDLYGTCSNNYFQVPKMVRFGRGRAVVGRDKEIPSGTTTSAVSLLLSAEGRASLARGSSPA